MVTGGAGFLGSHLCAALVAELDRALIARRAEIEHILDAWGVPRVPSPGQVEVAR